MIRNSKTGSLFLVDPHVVHLETRREGGVAKAFVSTVESKVKQDVLGLTKRVIDRVGIDFI